MTKLRLLTLLPFYFCRQINYTAHEILSILEENPPQQPTDIILFPPDESGNMSDEDSGNEDDDIKNVNHLGKGILSQMGELVTHHNEDNLEENDDNDSGVRTPPAISAAAGGPHTFGAPQILGKSFLVSIKL